MHIHNRPTNMIIFFILFVLQREITGNSFTSNVSNDIQREYTRSKERRSGAVLIMPCKIFCKYSSDVEIPDGNESISNDLIPNVQSDAKPDQRQDFQSSQSTESSGQINSDDDCINDDGRTKIVRRIFFNILGSVVIMAIGVICIFGVHRCSSNEKRDDLRTRPVTVASSSNYHRVGAGDCPDCAVRLNHPYSCDEAVDIENARTIETPPPPYDSPPPSYDEYMMSFICTRPQIRNLSTDRATTDTFV